MLGRRLYSSTLRLTIMEDPFAVAEHAVDAPVDEHAEFHVLKFAAGLEVLGRGLVVGLGGRGGNENTNECEDSR